MSVAWKWFVYILELKNDQFYTGLTWNISERLEQHLAGKGSRYTAKYGVRKLVYVEEHQNLEAARMRELQIKDFSQKKKKELISIFEGKNKNLM